MRYCVAPFRKRLAGFLGSTQRKLTRVLQAAANHGRSIAHANDLDPSRSWFAALFYFLNFFPFLPFFLHDAEVKKEERKGDDEH